MKKILYIAVLMLAAAGGCSSGEEYRTLKDIKRSGVLYVYVNPAGRPYAYIENGAPAGSEVELAEAVAVKLGVQPIYVTAADANDAFNAVAAGEADIAVGTLIETAAARGSVAFSADTGSEGLYAVGFPGETPNTVGGLENRIVGVVDGSASEYGLIISTARPSARIYYDTPENAVSGLMDGACNVIVCSVYEAEQAVMSHPGVLTAEYVTNAPVVTFSAMLPKNNAALAAEVNAVIKAGADAVLNAGGTADAAP